MFVVGQLPTIDSVMRFIAAGWNFVAKPRVYLHESYYVVQFQFEEDCNEVLFGGPYTMGRKMVIVNKWSPNFYFHEPSPLLLGA